jgi:hypothetical protein
MQSLYATGSQSHINCTRVAASCMQIVFVWPPVACNMNKIGRTLHATGGHVGTICMRLAVTRVPTGGHSVTRQETSRQDVCNRPSLHHNYIFYHYQVHILDYASDYSADGPLIFGLENELVLWMKKPHGSKFCTR